MFSVTPPCFFRKSCIVVFSTESSLRVNLNKYIFLYQRCPCSMLVSESRWIAYAKITFIGLDMNRLIFFHVAHHSRSVHSYYCRMVMYIIVAEARAGCLSKPWTDRFRRHIEAQRFFPDGLIVLTARLRVSHRLTTTSQCLTARFQSTHMLQLIEIARSA